MRSLVIVLAVISLSAFPETPVRGPQKSISLQEVLTIDYRSGADFVQVGEIVTDSESNIFVSDEYHYANKEFDSSGRYLCKYGKRGNAKGEFQAGPYKMSCACGRLAVVGVGSAIIQLFGRNFTPVNDTRAAGVVVDVALRGDGSFYSATIQRPSQSENILALYAASGKILSRLNLPWLKKDPILDMTCLCTDTGGSLIAVSLFCNEVAVFDDRQHRSAMFRVPTVPEELVQESDLAYLRSMPDNVFSDVDVDDRGNVFILAGPAARHPYRDVYVVDYRGNLQTTFQLPDQSGILHLDRKGGLFTRERRRSIVRKYAISYMNF